MKVQTSTCPLRNGENAMAFQPCPGIAEVVLNWLAQAGAPKTIVHVNNVTGDPWGGGELDVLCQEIFDIFSGALAPVVNLEWGFANCTAVDLGAENAATGSFTPGAFVPGEVTGEPMSLQTALCVTLRSGLTGRSARGRWYLPGWAESQSSGRLVATGSQASIAGAISDLGEGLDSLSVGEVCVLSRRSGGGIRLSGIGFKVIAYDLRNFVWASQRRRQQRP